MDCIGKIVDCQSEILTAEFDKNLHLPPPAFGSLLKADGGEMWLYGFVFNAGMKSVEPLTDKSNLTKTGFFKLFRTELQIFLVAYSGKEHSAIQIGLRAFSPKLNSPIYVANEQDWQNFAMHLEFLNSLLSPSEKIPSDELITAIIPRLANVYPDQDSFYIRVWHELSGFLTNDKTRFKTLMEKIARKDVSHGHQPPRKS